MRTTLFRFDEMQFVAADRRHEVLTSLTVPTLAAYAIEYAEFVPPPNIDAGYQVLCLDTHFDVRGDRVNFGTPFSESILGAGSCRLVVTYYGIRDFRLFFPQVHDQSLKDRLSEFLEESDVTFESGAWLSFALMAGAVYEGLLAWRLGNFDEPFGALIKRACEEGLMDAGEAQILTRARENRNLVHAGKAAEDGVTRARAMDMRRGMTRLIRKLAAAHIETQAPTCPS